MALAETGEIPARGQAAGQVPAGAGGDDAAARGWGPSAPGGCYEELDIDSLDALRAAAEEQQIRELKGFGPEGRGEHPRRRSTPTAPDSPRARFVLDRALAIAEQLVDALREHPASDRVELAGSARRMTDSVKDLDIIATAHDPIALAQAAAALELVERRRHRRRGRRAACAPTPA